MIDRHFVTVTDARSPKLIFAPNGLCTQHGGMCDGSLPAVYAGTTIYLMGDTTGIALVVDSVVLNTRRCQGEEDVIAEGFL